LSLAPTRRTKAFQISHHIGKLSVENVSRVQSYTCTWTVRFPYLLNLKAPKFKKKKKKKNKNKKKATTTTN
jgi:hypothetical protein